MHRFDFVNWLACITLAYPSTYPPISLPVVNKVIYNKIGNPVPVPALSSPASQPV